VYTGHHRERSHPDLKLQPRGDPLFSAKRGLILYSALFISLAPDSVLLISFKVIHTLNTLGRHHYLGGKKVKVFATKDPAEIDWTSVGAQVVIESTGRFTDAKTPPSTCAAP
jgi:hypothetical protein